MDNPKALAKRPSGASMTSNPKSPSAELGTPEVLPDVPYDARNWKAILQAPIRQCNGQRSKLEVSASYQTREDRARFYFRFFRELRSQGRFVDPRQLGERHVRIVVGLWVEQHLTPATMQKYLSHLRTFATWIGKPGLVRAPQAYLPNEALFRRSYVAQVDKGWDAQGIDADDLITRIQSFDHYVGAQLCAMRAFGLRPKEVAMLRPADSVVSADVVPAIVRAFDLGNSVTHYLLVERGTKGGRTRYIPINTPERQQAVDLLCREFPHHGDALGDPACSLKENRRRFRYVLERFGVTKAGLGVTAYGLRHQFAHDIYRRSTGTKAPIQAGAAAGLGVDQVARADAARQLGHSRVRIASAYLGSARRHARAAQATEDGGADEQQ